MQNATNDRITVVQRRNGAVRPMESRLRKSDAERRSAQLGGERCVAADLDPGRCLATGAEHGELAWVAGQGEAWPTATLLVGPSRRGDHDRGRDLLRHPAGAHASPEGIGQLRGDRAGFPAVLRATYVLDVDEELDCVHRPIEGAEEQRWPAPHGLDQLLPRGAIPHLAPHVVRVPGQRGPDESGPAVGSPFTDNEVRSQVGGRPTLAQRGGVRTTLDKQVTEGLAFLLSEARWCHGRILGKGGTGVLTLSGFGFGPNLSPPWCDCSRWYPSRATGNR